jgi:hypothetical protein
VPKGTAMASKAWAAFILYAILSGDIFITNKGLKTKEALFDKNQELTGKIVYTYTYH